MTLPRSEIASRLTRMVVMHWVKQGYSCFVQQGLNRRGKLRADVVAMNLHGRVIVTEVKSCKQDFVTDKKWSKYLEYCNAFYFACPQDYTSDCRELYTGVGVLVPTSNGHLRAVRGAKDRVMDGLVKRSLVIRLAWRAGTFSKRNTRRTRIYLE